MRVITGTARGRRLLEPEGMGIRPTTDKVKESIFNIVQFDIEGRRVLDLFAGSGQLGIEALSRGAAEAVFVDESNAAVKLVKENLKRCDLQAQVVRSDSLSYLEHCGKFGLIFIDPPYDTGLIEAALERIYRFDILEEGGIIVCESAADKAIKSPFGAGREYRYGKVRLTVFTREGQ